MIRATPRWLLWLVGFVGPALVLFVLGLIGVLGVEPLERWHHLSGHWSIWMLLATLAVTPLRYWTGVSFFPWRRTLGLMVFAWVCLHLLVWMLDQGVVARMVAEVLRRPHIAVGMVAFVLLIPLAVTSTNAMVKRLGPMAWRRLHQTVYLILGLMVLHHAMSLKTYWEAQLLWQVVACGLLMVARAGIVLRKKYTSQ